MSADLRRHPAGYLRHRGQQGQRAVRQLDGLISDRGDAGLKQRIGAGAGCRQVQVGEKHLVLAHPVVLLGDRLLYLQDQVTRLPHVIGRGQDLTAGGDEVPVGDGRARARAALDVDLVPAAD